MIFDISNVTFRHIMDDKRLFLPIRWKGIDFSSELQNHFEYFINSIEKAIDESEGGKSENGYDRVKTVCAILVKCVKKHLDGFPSQAYDRFCDAMRLLVRYPFNMYSKTNYLSHNGSDIAYADELDLYRVCRVYDNSPYPRTRVFHTPYNMRSKVSSSRYSIAGYPSLYLATSILLCCEEMHIDPYQDLAIVSRFRMEQNMEYANASINVIELAIKPQDFVQVINESDSMHRKIDAHRLNDKSVQEAYLLWYPLIAACSYIRRNKNDPFAAEYIVPQLLMQWVRSEANQSSNEDYAQLTGIRYFSCSSVKASDMGFNYVFPTSGIPISPDLLYCRVLSKAFRLTEPVFLNEYIDKYFRDCERDLKQSRDLMNINSSCSSM